MKKTLLCLGLLLVMALSFAACGGQTDNTTGDGSLCNGPPVYESAEEEFFWLDKAYENNLLAKEHIKSIAYYYNEQYYDGEIEYKDNFTPIPKSPSELDNETRNSIKLAYCEKRNLEKDLYDRVAISTYYGTYNGYIVFQLSTTCEVGGDPLFYPEYELGGVTFYNYTALTVYKKSS